MKKLIIIKLLFPVVIISASAYAQSTFKKFIADGNNTAPIGLIKTNLKYIWLGETYITTINNTGDIENNNYLSYNLTGHILRKNFGKNCISENNSLLLLYEDTYNFNGNSVLIKADTSLNIVWSYSYHDTVPLFGLEKNIFKHADRYVISALREWNGEAYLLHIDTGGVLKSRWKTNLHGQINTMISMNSTNFIWGGNFNQLGVCVMMTDTSGNLIWSKSLLRPPASLRNIVSNTDGTFMLFGTMDTITYLFPGTYYSHLFICKMDTAGNIIWAKKYGNINAAFGDIYYSGGDFLTAAIKAPDEGYLICSTLLGNSVNLGTDVVLIKTNTNGDVIWTRSHGNNGTNEAVTEVYLEPDSNFIFMGYSNAYPGATWGAGGTYLVKTDSLGHTSTLCQEDSVIVPYIPFFPNDSSIIVSVFIDTIGQSAVSLNVNSQPVWNTYDGCTLTGINNDLYNSNYKLKIYPNPTRDKINITAPAAPKAEDYITVYDSMGKIVLQRPYKEEKQQLDLSRLASGVYTIKIVQQERVSVGKVVVE